VQAEALAEFLAGFAVERIRCSPYARALATIAPFARRSGLAVEEDARLAERRLEHRDDWIEIVRASFAEPERVWPGAEAAGDVKARAWLAVSDLLASQRGLTAVVGHGQWISLVLHSLDPAFGFDAWRALTNPDVFLLYADASGARRFLRVWPEARSRRVRS
jgi:2,3-bisphosphoglycerate-dependent phosphoglycerate mutase